MPPAAEHLRRQAKACLLGGQWTAAQTALEALLRLQPDDVHASLQLGEVLRAGGNMRAASQTWLSLLPHLPADAAFIAQLATCLYFNGESHAARQCFEHAEVTRTDSAQALLALVRARQLLDEPAATLHLLERALAAGIDTPDEHLTRALMLEFTGQTEAATSELQHCLQRWPRFSGAALTLMRLRRQTDARHLATLRQHLQCIPLGVNPGIDTAYAEFQFATFKLLDDLGRHDEAWTALAAGNATMHRLHPYDASGHTAAIDAIIAQSPADATHATATVTDTGPLPIFIVGLPRSGSTLLERALSNHSQVASAGELGDFARQLRWCSNTPERGPGDLARLIARSAAIDPNELGRRYLAQTRWRAGGRQFYVDKLPNNYLFVDWIHRALPSAPIVHIHRAPMDACFSNFKAMFGASLIHTCDMPALAHHYSQYRRLMAHWQQRLPRRVLDVAYAQLVTDPDHTIARVLQHCGLAPEDACLHPESNRAAVSTFSSTQVRDPIHTRSLNTWRHYEAALRPLRDALQSFGIEP
ncbi:MAG TPA: sulfotransferase [Rhodanobacteraceae bacterium]